MRALVFALGLCAASGGCKSCHEAPPMVERRGVYYPRCAAIDPGGPTSWTVGGRALRREDSVVRDPRPSTRPAAVLVLGGPHGDVGAVDPRVARLGERLARLPVHVAVVLGGLDGDPDGVARWFDAVVPRDVPVVLVPADTEELAAFRALVERLSQRRPAVLDGTRVRLFAAADVEVVTIPGTAWPSLARRGGCVLDESDPPLLTAAVGAARAPRLLVSASAPLQQGAFAVDRGVLGVHVGSRAVAGFVASTAPRGVVTLLPRESAGTLGDLAGGAALAADVGAASFALSVGGGGAEPFETVGGALTGPMAWVIRVASDRTRVDRVE